MNAPLRTSLSAFHGTLLAAIGFAPSGCGGQVASDPSASASGGAGGSAGSAIVGGGFGSTGGFTSRPGSGGSATDGTGGRLSPPAGGVGGDGAGASEGDVAGGSGGSSGAAGEDDEGPENAFPCVDAEPVVDAASGYARCASGYVRRYFATTCSSPLPRPEPVPDYDPDIDACQFDTDCNAAPHGACVSSPPAPERVCRYGCVKDSECDEGSICLCGDPLGECVPADCVTDADCRPGFNCASYDSAPACRALAFSCQRPGDACGGDADCVAALGPDLYCSKESGARTCVPSSCLPGRPFLVGGTARVAPLGERSDWAGLAFRLAASQLEPTLRRRVALEWARAGQLEHASVAAFARFVLQLTSLGAPADLVSAAANALADEIVHARVCFSIAGHYAGHDVGPGPLLIQNSLDESSLLEIVVTTLLEGCVGETVAAVQAAEAAEHAIDPALRSALLRISADETRHAALAWRFVRWALDQGDAEVRKAAQRVFEQSAAKPGLPKRDDDELLLLSHGICSGAYAAALRAQTIDDVVRPCLQSLLELGTRDEAATEPASSAIS